MIKGRFQAPERLDDAGGRELFRQVQKARPSPDATVELDLSQTRFMDTLGGAWLVKMAAYAHGRNAAFECTGYEDGDIAQFMRIIEPGLALPERKPVHEEGMFEEIGGKAFKYVHEVRDFFGLVVDSIYWTLLVPLGNRGIRWGLLVDELHEMGVRAIRVNCLMNFLLGLIIAMLSAAQVEPLGLGIYVANLIVIAFARELAAVMTAVVVAARTGAAITAELATMKVQEEIDALRGMGLNVTQFLVAPKLIALVLVMPCLVALGMVCGVLGGAVWGILVMDYAPDKWFRQTFEAAQVSDVNQGLLKAVCFAIMIVLIGCHNGLRVRGGSRGVGLMTTRSVVMDIFFIITIDMIFAALVYYVFD